MYILTEDDIINRDVAPIEPKTFEIIEVDGKQYVATPCLDELAVCCDKCDINPIDMDYCGKILCMAEERNDNTDIWLKILQNQNK